MSRINKHHFFYKLFALDASKKVKAFLGNAFPISSDGTLLTCKHCVYGKIKSDETLTVFDGESNQYFEIENATILDLEDIDLAVLPKALPGEKKQFIPILEPLNVLVGLDVYTWGFYSFGKKMDEITQGFFKGNIVSFLDKAESKYHRITVSFPIIEGMSGSPLLTYCNGVKLVGINTGNIQSRITAYEFKELEDSGNEYKESINRIIEFGVAYHALTVIKFLKCCNLNDFVVSAKKIEVNS